MSRRTARRHVFILVFQFPFHQPYDGQTLEESYRFYLEGLEESEKPGDKDAVFIQKEVEGVYGCTDRLDGLISEHLKDWQIDRINKTDLAILRLGLYEMLYEQDIPVGVSVNEAVELAKVYGTDESPAFVNGVLGGASRSSHA